MSPDVMARRDLVLLRRYHLHGDQDARTEMVTRGLPLVRSLARRYHGKGEPYDDLVQVGSVGLVKAIDRFDVRAGHPFVAFAVPNITGEIKRHFRDFTWVAHVPRAIQELDARVRVATDELGANGHPVTEDDLARRLGESVERVREAILAREGHRAASLHDDGGDDGPPRAITARSDPALRHVEIRDLLRECSEVLTDRERAILWMRFFVGMLQREIAAQIGVSQMQVSRLITGALERMRVHAEAPQRPELAVGREANRATRSGLVRTQRHGARRRALSRIAAGR